MFGAMFVEQTAEIDRTECIQRAKTVGLSEEQFTRELDSPQTEQELEQTAQQARSAGAFGVPSFVLDDKIFFGNDRLVLVRHFLEKATL